MNEENENSTEINSDETYSQMFAEYVESQEWLKAPELMPLVFHARKLCRQLDTMIERDGTAQAAKDSAYLQAVERLHKRRPGAAPADPGVPGQTDVFDFMDD